MKYATIRLSKRNDHTQYLDLKYQIIDNHFTRKWINCVLQAQQEQHRISEPWAIYNINDNLNDDFVLQKLNSLMKSVDQEHVLFGFNIDSISDQDKLNKIHAIFEQHHGQLDEWKTNPIFRDRSENFRRHLSEINQIVHACEGRQGSPKIRVVWFDLPKVNKFDSDDYKLFTNKRTFGSLYHLYADVGKGVEALAEDNDEHHHDIVPNIHFSADCVAYFHNDTKDDVHRMETSYKNYIDKNIDYIRSKGFDIDDPRLTTGRVELARLEYTDEKLIMDQIKEFDYIQSFFLS